MQLCPFAVRCPWLLSLHTDSRDRGCVVRQSKTIYSLALHRQRVLSSVTEGVWGAGGVTEEEAGCPSTGLEGDSGGGETNEPPLLMAKTSGKVDPCRKQDGLGFTHCLENTANCHLQAGVAPGRVLGETSGDQGPRLSPATNRPGDCRFSGPRDQLLSNDWSGPILFSANVYVGG